LEKKEQFYLARNRYKNVSIKSLIQYCSSL